MTCTSIGAGRPKLRICDTMSAGQEREGRAGKFLRQQGAQLAHEVLGRPMVFLEADQGVAVRRSDRAGVLVGHVDAGERQADIVDDIVELIGRDGLADRLLDEIEQPRGLLDAGAGLGADVHQNLPESTAGKKFWPRNGHRPKETTTQARKPAMKVLGKASASNSSAR